MLASMTNSPPETLFPYEARFYFCFWFLAVLLFACGCATSMPPQDVASLHDAEELDLRLYLDPDATAITRQLARAAYCAVASVVRRQKSAPWDAENAITCVPKMP